MDTFELVFRKDHRCWSFLQVLELTKAQPVVVSDSETIKISILKTSYDYFFEITEPSSTVFASMNTRERSYGP
jgi:hypothetical protein